MAQLCHTVLMKNCTRLKIQVLLAWKAVTAPAAYLTHHDQRVLNTLHGLTLYNKCLCHLTKVFLGLKAMIFIIIYPFFTIKHTLDSKYSVSMPSSYCILCLFGFGSFCCSRLCQSRNVLPTRHWTVYMYNCKSLEVWCQMSLPVTLLSSGNTMHVHWWMVKH